MLICLKWQVTARAWGRFNGAKPLLEGCPEGHSSKPQARAVRKEARRDSFLTVAI